MSYWKDTSFGDLNGEEWKPIESASGYQISNFGRVRSMNYRNQNRIWIMRQREAKKNSYLKIDLDKYKWRPSVHRLVASHFIPNPDNKAFVNHKDGNKQNNHFSNLEWVTRSENTTHAFRVLKIKHAGPSRGRFGGNHSTAKSIIQLGIDNNLIQKWGSTSEASRALKINDCNISACLRKKHKTAGGFKWEYA